MEPCVERLLPSSYEYIVSEFEKQSENTFNIIIRTNIYSERDANSWLKEFEETAKLNFRVIRTYPHGTPSKLLFKKDYRCHHNTRANLPSSKTQTPSKKHVNCKAFLRITLKNFKMKKSKDKYLCTHPCEITLKHNHNHATDSADILRHRKPNQETEKKVLKLFSKGHSPSSALHIIKADLKLLHGTNFDKYAADGATCPPLQWMYHKYYTHYKKIYGAKDGFDADQLKNLQIIKLTDDVFFVKNLNDKKEYEVNMLLEECTCVGKNKEDVCKHQLAVANKFNIRVDETDHIGNYEAVDIKCEEITLPTTSTISKPTESNSIDDKATNIKEDLKRIFTELALEAEDPETLKACKVFIDNFNKIKTKSALLTSLCSFGQNKNYIQNKNNIKVSPITQRKIYLGPCKSQNIRIRTKRHVPEHGYCISNIQWKNPIKRRKITESPYSTVHIDGKS